MSRTLHDTSRAKAENNYKKAPPRHTYMTKKGFLKEAYLFRLAQTLLHLINGGVQGVLCIRQTHLWSQGNTQAIQSSSPLQAVRAYH